MLTLMYRFGFFLMSETSESICETAGALRLYFVRDPAPTHDRVIPSFDVADRDAAVRHLEASGCTRIPIGPHSPDGYYLRDPSGVVFDVIQRDATD